MRSPPSPSPTQPPSPGTFGEVFRVFLQLGVTSFGGPIAHIAYFREELVKKRRWVDDAQFGQLLAICQFLPGPASSQLGFSLGLLRHGWAGGLAAFLAFTLPSAILLLLLSTAVPLAAGPVGHALMRGAKLMACAVVAHAVLGMASQLCPDRPRQTIAVLTAIAVLWVSTASAQVGAVVLAAGAGIVFMPKLMVIQASSALAVPYGRKLGITCLLLFFSLLVGLPALASSELSLTSAAEAFARSGALVFGGGHVVLPLLEEAVVRPGWLTADEFFAGYGAAQGIPGPLFTFAAYLGALLAPPGHTLLWSATAVVCIFLPGLLLIAGILPWWQTVARYSAVLHAIAGINAAVVGLLAAALYHPLFTHAVASAADMALVVAAWGLLSLWRVPAAVVLAGCLAVTAVPAWLAP